MVPRPTSSSSECAVSTNLRMLTAQCWRVMSGITTCRREPSGNIASTNGVDRSTRRPLDFSIFSTRSRTSPDDRMVVVSSLWPRRATNTRPGSLIQVNGRPRYRFLSVRAAIYTRISRDAEGEGLGVQRQRDDCRALCARRGWAVVGEYTDNDVSAYSGRRRPEYQRLLSDVRGGLIDVVVAWAPERLHRSPRELEDFLELIESAGIGVETIKAGAWDVATSHGRLVARMLGAVSRAESERMGERIRRAHQQAKDAGYWRGPIPFGMRPSDQPGAPEPEPETAGIVEKIFQRVTRGDSLSQIARDLN